MHAFSRPYPLDNSPGYLINRLAAKMNAVLHKSVQSPLIQRYRSAMGGF